jgi:AcrR family transcriptional regulator
VNAATRTAPARRRFDLRDDRRQTLLDAAAAEFNLYGVAGAQLSRIARAIGLTRAALYYYFTSREDLAFHCYVRACRTTAGDLAAARAAGRSGLERIRRFIEVTLDPSRAPAVVLSEIACLGEARRDEVEAAHGANVAALTQFVADGMRDRSIRDCDAEVVAQALIGMLAWLPLAEEWSAGTGELVRRNASRALVDLVSNGVAANPDYPFHCPLDIAAFGFRPGNAFDRGAASAMKVELLTRTASRLFNRRGIDGTSLDQITQALGATKGAFYQYIPDKTSLIVECHKRQLLLALEIADAAGKAGRNGLERALFGLHLLVQAYASEVQPLSPLTGLEALPAKARSQIRRRGQELARRYEQYNEEGIGDGSYRPFEVRTLAVVGAGVFSWIPKWRADDDPRPPRAVADETTALFLRGLRRKQ